MSDATHGGKGDRDRTADKEKFWDNYDRIFRKDGKVVEKKAETETDRKLREWELMYTCLKNMYIYEYPVQEAEKVLKLIKKP